MRRVTRCAVILGFCLFGPLTLSGLAGISAAATVKLHAPAAAKASPLPSGAATGYPFGYVMDEGSKTSLLPPNDNDVDQARVAAAPRLGPFAISPAGSPSGWPDACKLTSLVQLKALDPSITALRGAPVGTKAELLGTGHKQAPHNTECQFNLKTTFQPPDYGSTGSYVTVQFEEIDSGAPALFPRGFTGKRVKPTSTPPSTRTTRT